MVSLSLVLSVWSDRQVEAHAFSEQLSGWHIEHQSPDGSLLVERNGNWLIVNSRSKRNILPPPSVPGIPKRVKRQYLLELNDWVTYDLDSFSVYMGKDILFWAKIKSRIPGKPRGYSEGGASLGFGVSPNKRFLLISYLNSAKLSPDSAEPEARIALLRVTDLKLIRTYSGQSPEWISKTTFTFSSENLDFKRGWVSKSGSEVLQKNIRFPAFISGTLYGMNVGESDDLEAFDFSHKRMLPRSMSGKASYGFAYINCLNLVKEQLSHQRI